MGVNAEPRIGELGHVRSSDQNETSPSETRNDGGVFSGRGGVGKRPGAGCCRLTANIRQVLDGDRDAGELRRRIASLPKGIGGVGCLPGGGSIDRDEGTCTFARGILDLLQTCFDRLATCRLAIRQARRELGDRWV